MRRLLGLLVVVVLLLAAGCAATPHTATSRRSSPSVTVDTPALRAQKARAGIASCTPGRASNRLPAITLPCLGGGPSVDLTRLRGPLVINLFAQWCGPCRSELPYYQRLHRKAKGTVGVLGVDYLDPQPAAALALARHSGVTYPLAADPDGTLRTDLRVRGLPGIVLLDGSGRVAAVEYRSVRSYAELRGLVQDALHVRIPA